jgi:hypothetical protein
MWDLPTVFIRVASGTAATGTDWYQAEGDEFVPQYDIPCLIDREGELASARVPGCHHHQRMW